MPVPSGSTRSRITASGGSQRRGGERALGGVGGVDLVAGAAQARAQRAQDLLLVVDDEDAGARSHAPPATGSRRRRQRRATKVAPCSARDSTQMRPPLASAKPRAIASPSPAPGGAPAPPTALERLEDPLALAGGDARAVVDDAHERLGRRRRRPGPAPARRGGEYLSAFSIRFTSTRWICCASTRDRGRLVGQR